MVAAGESGRLVTLPGADPGAHRVEVEIEVSLDDDAVATYLLSSRLFGQPSRNARATYRAASESRRDFWIDLTATDWPGSSFGDYELVAEDDAGSFVERISIRLENANQKSLALLPSAAHWLPKANVREREIPIVYSYPREISFSTQLRGAPDDVTLHQSVEREIEGLSISAEMTQEGEVVSAVGKVTLGRTRFATSEFRGLRKAFASMRSIAGFSVSY